MVQEKAQRLLLYAGSFARTVEMCGLRIKRQTGQAVKQRECWELCFRTVFLINLLQLSRILKAGGVVWNYRKCI